MPVFESHKPHDIKFVAKVIRDNGLSPWPLKGWYKEFPPQWSDPKRGRNVQLEGYEWGTVVFASQDTEPKWSSTLVCVGEVDWEGGVVTTPTECDPIPIPWVFAITFKVGGAVMPKVDDKLPECLGYHDHCPTCDGGMNTVTGTVEIACPWRMRCYTLKLYLMENNQQPDEFLDSMLDSVTLHTKLAEIERERADRVPPPAAGLNVESGLAKGTLTPKPRERKRRRKGHSHNPISFTPLEPYVRSFLRRLEKMMTELGYGWAKSRASALPGYCYVHRVAETANYITVYVASKRGRYAKLAIVRYKVAYRCIDIAFNCEWEKALGVPNTRLRKVSLPSRGTAEWHGIRDKKTARIAARRIARMASEGIIKLPPPYGKPN